MPPTYCLVVPMFNEEAVIPVLLKRLDALLEALDTPAEVILVNDGSRDSSAIVIEAKARADKRYRLIRSRSCRGEGPAALYCRARNRLRGRSHGGSTGGGNAELSYRAR